jgi:hypothetical protein
LFGFTHVLSFWSIFPLSTILTWSGVVDILNFRSKTKRLNFVEGIKLIMIVCDGCLIIF